MSKMINQDAVLKIILDWEEDWNSIYSAVLNLPAVQLHVNKTSETEHDIGNVLTPDSAAIRDAALAEAAAAAWAVEGGDRWTRSAAQAAILALKGEKP